MQTVKRLILGMMLAAFLLPSAAFAAEVAQGVCQTYDHDGKVITIEEYDTNFDAEHKYGTPTGIITEFEVTKAKIGIEPESGDILRFAYVLHGDKRQALKVMNVSKQDLMKK